MKRRVAIASFVVVACTTDYQLGLDDPNFGAPNSLDRESQPGASNDPSGKGEGANGSSIACVAAGGALVDGGACSVRFKDDIVPMLARSSCTLTACHGGVSPPNPPRIDLDDVPGMWPIFAAFKMSAGSRPYINPCSTDKTQSGFACNLAATGTCGVKMPQGGPQMDQADIDKIDAWLACGSPNN